MSATVIDPILQFRLVGRWTQIEMNDDRTRAKSIRDVIASAFGAADDLALQRAGMRRQLTEAVIAARQAGASGMFIASEIGPNLPMPVTMSVYSPQELRMSPSVGTRSEQVIGAAETALRALDSPGVDTAVTFAHPQSHVLRTHRYQATQPDLPDEFGASPEEDKVEISTFVVDYWIAVPGSKRTVLVNFFTPIVQIPNLMLALFDGIVKAAYFEEVRG